MRTHGETASLCPSLALSVGPNLVHMGKPDPLTSWEGWESPGPTCGSGLSLRGLRFFPS